MINYEKDSSVAFHLLCHSGHLTEDPRTDAAPLVLIPSPLNPSLPAPTLTLQAGLDLVPGPDPKADQGICLLHRVSFSIQRVSLLTFSTSA